MKNFIKACKRYTIGQMVKLFWFYIWGHILGFLFYKRKYYYGKWFRGNFGGLAAPGWRWICIDVRGRRFNPDIPWPCSPHIRVGNFKNIHFHPDDINNFQGAGNYFQAIDGHIYIGQGTWIAMNVGIITANHLLDNLEEHAAGQDVVIGKNCWLGMNSIILPGVVLGNHTVVGAGAIVTKSFPEGNCVLAGNPAKKIKELEFESLKETNRIEEETS